MAAYVGNGRAKLSSVPQLFLRLLPLWLLSYAVMAEGFPAPPIPVGLAVTAFILAIVIGILGLWKDWIRVELLLYYVIPYWLMIRFDEISTAYKTPFILLCAMLLSTGVLGYQGIQNRWLRWLSLLLGAALTLAAAGVMVNGYWGLVSAGGYDACYPRCLPPADPAHPWWMIFFVV